VNGIFSKLSASRGPFSAVRPSLDLQVEERSEVEVEDPSDGFERSESYREDSADRAAPPTEALRESSGRSGMQAALRAFPQVVHLLANPEEHWGEQVSEQVGLPLISLEDGSVETLEAELSKSKYADGFVLEGYPSNAESAEKLESLLGNVSDEGRRVVGWDLSNSTHQEVIDHYVNRDLLWMVPESTDPSSRQEACSNLMSCLQGLPALQ